MELRSPRAVGTIPSDPRLDFEHSLALGRKGFPKLQNYKSNFYKLHFIKMQLKALTVR